MSHQYKLIYLIIIQIVSAEYIDIDSAEKLANTFYKQKLSMERKIATSIISYEIIADEGYDLFYIFNLSSIIFC